MSEAEKSTRMARFHKQVRVISKAADFITKQATEFWGPFREKLSQEDIASVLRIAYKAKIAYVTV